MINGVEVVSDLLCGRQGLLPFGWCGDVDEFYCFVEYVDFVAVEFDILPSLTEGDSRYRLNLSQPRQQGGR